MNRHVFQFVFAAGILFCSLAIAGEKLWVISENADLKMNKRISSPAIASLSKGAELVIISHDKKWYKVITRKDEKGWIHQNHVSGNPPKRPESENLKELLGELPESSIKPETARIERSIRGRIQVKSDAADQQKEESGQIRKKLPDPEVKPIENQEKASIEFKSYNSKTEKNHLPERIWAANKNIELKAEKKRSADTIKLLEPGSELIVISCEESWYQVETSEGEKGWIHQDDVLK